MVSRGGFLLLPLFSLLVLAPAVTTAPAASSTLFVRTPLRLRPICCVYSSRRRTSMVASAATARNSIPPPLHPSHTVHEPSSLTSRAEDYSILAAKTLTLSQGWIFPSEEGREEGREGGFRTERGRVARVVIKRSVRDVDRDRQRTYLHQMQLVFPSPDPSSFCSSSSPPPPPPYWEECSSSVPVEVTGVLALTLSPSGRYTVLFKEEEGGREGEKEVYVEIYGEREEEEGGGSGGRRGAGGGSTLVRSVKLSEVHGVVMGDSWFGAFAWDEEETCLGYVAAAKGGKGRGKSAFEVAPFASGSGNGDGGRFGSSREGGKEEEEEEEGRGRFVYREDWGEKFEQATDLGLFLLSVRTGRVGRVGGVPRDVTPGGVVLSKRGGRKEGRRKGEKGGGNESREASPSPSPPTYLLYTGWADLPRRLGSIYCYNRPSSIYAVNVQQLIDALNHDRDSSSSSSSSSVSSPSSSSSFSTSSSSQSSAAAGAGGKGDGKKTATAAASGSPPPPFHICLTTSEALARSPVFSNDGQQLAYLGNDDGFDTHNGPMALRAMRWREVVREAEEEKEEEELQQQQENENSVTSPTSSPSPSSSPPLHSPHITTLISPVLDPSPSHHNNFPGLWTDSLLSPSCWSQGDAHIYLTSVWGSSNVLLRVATKEGGTDENRVEKVEEAMDAAGGREGGSVSLLAMSVEMGGMLVAASSPNSPGGFGFLAFPHEEVKEGGVEEGKVDDSSTQVHTKLIENQTKHLLYPAPQLHSSTVSSSAFSSSRYKELSRDLKNMRWRVLKVQPKKGVSSSSSSGEGNSSGTSTDLPFEAILLLPPSKGSSPSSFPLLAVPHGGPHSCTLTSFSPSSAFLCLSYGFSILHVNYRGSTGFGAGPLESLAGRIGENDVDDVYQAVLEVLKEEGEGEESNKSPTSDKGGKEGGGRHLPSLDKMRVGIVGGSHGGFLGAHAVAQHPELFRVAALRNPVTNIASMTTSTDIPDWCWGESLGLQSYDYSTFMAPSGEQLAKMWASSPIALVDQVKAPVLLALGKKDRRVPFSQGLEYYHALRARGVPVKLLIYEDDVHAIDRPKSEADHWLHIGEWLHRHLQ